MMMIVVMVMVVLLVMALALMTARKRFPNSLYIQTPDQPPRAATYSNNLMKNNISNVIMQ